MFRIIVYIILLFIFLNSAQGQDCIPPEEFHIGAIVPVSVFIGDFFVSPAIPGLAFAARYATQLINNNPDILPYTTLKVSVRDTASLEPNTLAGIVSLINEEVDSFVGPVFADETEIAANAAISSVFNKFIMAQNGADSLNNKEFYDTLARIVSPVEEEADVMIDLLYYLAEKSQEINIGDQYKGYLNVAILGTATPYGISLASSLQIKFRDLAAVNDTRPKPQILTYQSVLSASQDKVLAADVDKQLIEIKNSEARVILYIGAGADLQIILNNPLIEELTGPRYLWIVSDQAARPSVYLNLTNIAERFPVISELKNLTNGFIGVVPPLPGGINYRNYINAFEAFFEPIAPNLKVDVNSPRLVDTFTATALALDYVLNNGSCVTPSNLRRALPEIQFEGVTGNISFTENYDRTAAYDIVNVYPDHLRDSCLECIERAENNYWMKVASWTREEGIVAPFQYPDYPEIELPFRFFNGSSLYPNLDVRDPITYWSCHDKKEYTDETGLIVILETPNGNNPNNIDETYICDQFIDCNNMSDEGYDCTPSFVILFIVMGVVVGFITLANLIIFVPFVIIFGCIISRRRVRVASPLFLLIIVFSSTVGLISTYSWYGKDHTVACIFRVWLTALAVISMVAALFAKTFRIWRIFKNVGAVNRISDLELIILWFIQILPALILVICWTAFSTPTAKLEEIDDNEHYVCTTGGLTGKPGGIIWFSLIVGYGALLLFMGVILTYLIRRVPSEFNEGKLLAVSIYNFTFLCIVIIPVYFVLENVSPFAAWLLRTLAILYGFLATVYLQFIPIIIRLCFDKCGDSLPNSKDTLSGSSSSSVSGTMSSLKGSTRNDSDSGESMSGMATMAPR